MALVYFSGAKILRPCFQCGAIKFARRVCSFAYDQTFGQGVIVLGGKMPRKSHCAQDECNDQRLFVKCVVHLRVSIM